MTHLRLCVEFETGRSVEFIPKHIEAFGIRELWSFFDKGDASCELHIATEDPVIDGKEQKGNATVKSLINFNEQPYPFALVPGGWLPLAFAIPPRFLVDRNVIADLRKLKNGQGNMKLTSIECWASFFKDGGGTFNPLPYAWEGGLCRMPTFEEFVQAFDKGVLELRSLLPNSQVITYGASQYRTAYQIVKDFEPLAMKETEFLCSISPLVADRVPRGKEHAVEERLVLEARKLGLGLNSLIFIAALSCLYDDPHGNIFSIGRKLLKPSRNYKAEDAFNALSDLRQIELVAAGQAYFSGEAFSLSTSDHGLASLWCALSPRGISPNGTIIEFTFDLTKELFPRLAGTDMTQVRNLVCE